MASLSLPSRARSADRLSSSRFISRASGHAVANAASIGAMECLRAWIRAMRMFFPLSPHPPWPKLRRMWRGEVYSLLERHRVHQATLAPEAVEAAFELERARLADVALVDFAVIAGGLECGDQPFVVQPKPRAEIAGGAEQALDGRRLRLRHLVDIGLGHTEFFGFDQAVVQPGDDVAPDLVAVA